MAQRLLNPRMGQIMLGLVGFPHTIHPGAGDASAFGGGWGIPHIGDGQRAQKGQDGRFFELTAAVEPVLDGSVNVRVGIMLQPAAQAGQVGGIGFCRGAVPIEVLLQ